MIRRSITTRNRSSPRAAGSNLPPVAAAGTTTRVVTEVLNPAITDDDTMVMQMSQAVLQSQRGDGVCNTTKAYSPKRTEYEKYIELVYADDPLGPILDANKVSLYIFYQCAREMKPRGGGKKKTPDFDLTDFHRITGAFRANMSSRTINFPVPTKGVGVSVLRQHKAVIRQIYDDQVLRKAMSRPWDHIWTSHCERLLNMIKGRKPLQRKANNSEKAFDCDINPYRSAMAYPDVEEMFWMRGMSKGAFQAAVDLRSRSVLTYSTSAILRYDSLQWTDLSDFLAVRLQRKQDPHPALYMINEIPRGKTHSDGHMQFGRATRHKNVRLCAVNGVVFYLASRFDVSKEFEKFPLEDWMDNKKWFNIKYLTDVRISADHTARLSDNQYANTMKEILEELDLPLDKIKHWGRKTGPKLLELEDESPDDINPLGQWNMKTQQKSYSAKLPLSIIRSIAGYDKKQVYFNPRTTVPVCRTLLLATPFGVFFEAYDFVKGKVEEMLRRKKKDRPKKDDIPLTALRFLGFMKECASILVQDAAAMMILHPERSNHPLFRLECFTRLVEFQVRAVLSTFYCTLRNLLYHLTTIMMMYYCVGVQGADENCSTGAAVAK